MSTHELRRGLTVLGVSVDPDKRTAAEFLRRHKTTFTAVLDANGVDVKEAYGSWKFPEAYLLDAEGRVVAVWLGSVKWRSRDVRDLIEGLLPRDEPIR